MTRTPKTMQPSTGLRRSSRLSSSHDDTADHTILRNGKRAKRVSAPLQPAPPQASLVAKTKARTVAPSVRSSTPSVKELYLRSRKSVSNGSRGRRAESPKSGPSGSDLSRYHKLLRREEEIEAREKDVKRKLEELQREMQDALIVTERRKAEELLAHLDDVYTCALCYEIFAYPLTFIPHACGHTFCAGCLVRWFLARMRECAHWHEELDCPVCRAPHTAGCDYAEQGCVDEGYPCMHVSYPCPPNRQVTAALTDLVDKLDVCIGELGEAAGEELLKWAVGGETRCEWQKRSSAGQKEAASFERAWQNRHFTDLLTLKRELGV